MARPTATELRALASAKKTTANLVDELLDEAKKVAITGENSLDVSKHPRYARLTDAEREILHAELVSLGFKVEENRDFPRYFWEIKW